MAQIFVVMGVSGSGKSTVGQALAENLQSPFYEGDDFHPPENVAKMARGVPLDDGDRAPWLAEIANLIEDCLQREQTAVIACSALKKSYRDQLRVSEDVQFIYMKGSYDLIWQRMQARGEHFMRADMLQSQYDTLEEPDSEEALTVAVDREIECIVTYILRQID